MQQHGSVIKDNSVRLKQDGCFWHFDVFGFIIKRDGKAALVSTPYTFTLFYVALCLHMKSSMMSESQSTSSCLYSSWFCDSVSTLLLGSTAEH